MLNQFIFNLHNQRLMTGDTKINFDTKPQNKKLNIFHQKKKLNIPLNRLKEIKKLNELRLAKAEDIFLRQQFLDNQNLFNYRSEYDRLRGALTKNIFHQVIDNEKDKNKREFFKKIFEEEEN